MKNFWAILLIGLSLLYFMLLLGSPIIKETPKDLHYEMLFAMLWIISLTGGLILYYLPDKEEK